MPCFRIVSEPDPAAPCRHLHGTGIERTVTIVEAAGLAEAAAVVHNTEPHHDRRITLPEEVGTGLVYTDAEITAQLHADRVPPDLRG